MLLVLEIVIPSSVLVIHLYSLAVRFKLASLQFQAHRFSFLKDLRLQTLVLIHSLHLDFRLVGLNLAALEIVIRVRNGGY